MTIGGSSWGTPGPPSVAYPSPPFPGTAGVVSLSLCTGEVGMWGARIGARAQKRASRAIW